MLSCGSLASSTTQSPSTIFSDGTDATLGARLTRGARAGAPRRDTTMTQDSDSGDAAGDAGPTTDSNALWRPKVKIGLIAATRRADYESLRENGTGKQLPSNYIAQVAFDVRVAAMR